MGGIWGTELETGALCTHTLCGPNLTASISNGQSYWGASFYDCSDKSLEFSQTFQPGFGSCERGGMETCVKRCWGACCECTRPKAGDESRMLVLLRKCSGELLPSPDWSAPCGSWTQKRGWRLPLGLYRKPSKPAR